MGKSSEEKEVSEVSWPLLLFVTGCSLIIFSFILKFLDGNQPKFMLWGGAAALLLSFLFYLGKKPENKEDKKRHSDIFDDI